MKFELIRKYDNVPIMSTEHADCIGLEFLDSQEKSGYYFKLDGKRITANELKKKFFYKDSQSTKGSESYNDNKSASSVHVTTRKVRAIRCINNNKVYTNMSEAGKDLGLDSALISYSLKVNRPTKGYSFEFVE